MKMRMREGGVVEFMCVVNELISSFFLSSSFVDLNSYWSDCSHCKQRREKKESERLLFR